MNTSGRRVVIALVAIVFALLFLPDFAPMSSGLGFNQTGGGIVTSVRPGGPAQKAGVAVGDRLLLDRLSPVERLRLGAAPVGYIARVSFQRGGAVRTVELRAAISPKPPITPVVVAQALLLLLVGAIVGMRRPDALGIWFFAFCTTGIPISPVIRQYAFLPDWLFAPLAALLWFWEAPLQTSLLIPFALYFPNGRIEPWKKRISPWVWASFALFAVYAAVTTYQDLFGTGAASFEAYIELPAPLLVVIVILAVDYIHAGAGVRSKMAWLFAGLASFVTASAFAAFGTGDWVAYAIAAFGLLSGLLLAYAVVRHHIFDIAFTINRAIVYGSLTLSIAIVLALLDWLLSKYVGSTNVALAADALVAIGFGLMLDGARKRLEAFVDLAIFRDRYEVERHLRRVIASLPFAESTDAIVSTLTTDASRALGLTFSLCFIGDSPQGEFRRIATYGALNGAPEFVESDDLLVRLMRAELQPIRFSELAKHSEAWFTADREAMAFPLLHRNVLRGFVVYGHHSNGLAIDPAEISLLSELTSVSTASYDYVEAVQNRERLREAETRVSALTKAFGQSQES